jgi:hypothetical protein
VTLDELDAAEWERCARRGDFASAWQTGDRILQRHRAAPDRARPRHLQSVWRGESPAGKRVLVRCYHGLGDTIQFIRFVPRLAMIAREIAVWAQPSLIPLLRTVHGIDRLLPLHDGEPDADYDIDIEVMELPFVLRATLDTIPRKMPYLQVEPAGLPGSAPRVGLAWRAGDWERQRSMPFDALRPLLDLAGFTWCSLQQGRRPDESHPALFDVSDGGLVDLARRVAGLDLVITVDSMPAHLAGALDVPVWTLLLHRADWRWMEERADSPWYPTMRLFRRGADEDWDGLSLRLRDALAAVPDAPPCRNLQ